MFIATKQAVFTSLTWFKFFIVSLLCLVTYGHIILVSVRPETKLVMVQRLEVNDFSVTGWENDETNDVLLPSYSFNT